MQDRIVGPLTMAQFVYAIVGSGLAYGAWSSLPAPVSTITAILIGILTACIIFVKINEQPFLKFAAFVLQFIINPKKLIWQQVKEPKTKVQFYIVKKGSVKVSGNTVSSSDISNLAHKIDSFENEKLLNKR